MVWRKVPLNRLRICRTTGFRTAPVMLKGSTFVEAINELRQPSSVKVFGAAVALPSTALLTTVEGFTVMAVICLAPILADSCKAVSTNASSITFAWSRASSATGITNDLLNGTTVIARTATTTVTIGSLTAGAYYVFSLYAYTNGSNSSSSAVSCYCWTGE
jgi:hypothetical protein